MSRFFPQPLVTLTLLAFWLLAWNSLEPGLLLLGLAVAVTIPYYTARFWPEYPRVVRYAPLLRFILRFLYDVVVANLSVAVLILGPKSRLRTRFLVIPLSTRDPYVTTLLASIISLTPGTVSSNLSGDGSSLLVHALDSEGEEADIARIKRRYETPLMEIFPC
jgi:multicomponent K+:H+ antiporter subunit E